MVRHNIKDIPFEYGGRIQTFRNWVKELGLDYNTVAARYRYGKTPATGLFAPTSRTVLGMGLVEWLGTKLYTRIAADAEAHGLTPEAMTRYYVIRGMED